MNDVKLAHPEIDRLKAFAQGRLGEAELLELSSHLSHCTECRNTVEAAGDDTLVSLLRAADTEHETTKRQEAVTLAVSESTPAIPGLPPELASHNRYRVQELLGVGGMGAVYKAEHLLMERPVALKLINHSLTSNPAMVERFRREVKTAAKLKHPNIVMAYDAETAGDSHFLVMEYVEGTSLSRLVADKGPLPVHQACDYIRQAALGLQHAHERGMVHRDIKPQNLMIQVSQSPTRERGAGEQPLAHASGSEMVKILDFGLARFAMEAAPAGALLTAPETPASPGSESLTQVGTVMGTPDYIAPEQARDAHTADIRADIYSLGCTLYDLLAGHAPFPDGTILAKVMAHAERMPRPLTELRKDVPPALARVIERMMAKDPAQRYQTPAEVAAALTPFVAAPSKPRRGWRTLAAAAALAAAILVAGAIIYVQTDTGEFKIETNDDNVAVMVNDKGVKIRDQSTGREYLLKAGSKDVRTGTYEIVVSELPDGIEISGGKTFTVRRGGQVVATATLAQGKPQAATADQRSDEQRLQGVWKLVGVEEDGKTLPAQFIPTQMNMVLTFAGDKADLKWVQPRGIESFKLKSAWQGVFHLDAKATPKRINVFIPNDNENSMLGIYKLEDNKLTLRYRYNPKNLDYPKEFATTKGDGTYLLVLERQQPSSAGKGIAGFPKTPAAKPDAADYELIQGTWKPVSAGVQGQQIAEQIFKAIGPTVTFTDKKVTWRANPTPEARDLFGAMLAKFSLEGALNLDPTKSPKTIDITVLGAGAKTPLGTPAPRALLGIYKLEGDSLELCIAIDPDHVEDRPTKFESVPGKFIVHIKARREPAAPWSEAVEGLQCRLRADRTTWNVGEVPSFRLDVRDQAKRDVVIHVAQAACKLQFDGVWFDWAGPVSIPAGTWPAGGKYDDFEVAVTLDPRWKNGDKSLDLKPGKHKVRVAYVTLDRDKPVRVESNAVEIEIEPPPGKLINSFGTGFKPITRDLVEDDGAWRIATSQERVVRLYEVQPPLEDCLVTYRARIKCANLTGKAYAEMWCRFPHGGEAFSRGLMNPLSGTKDWTTVETRFLLQKDEQPDLLKLNVHVEGAGTVWIKDIELWQAPLPAELKWPSNLKRAATKDDGRLTLFSPAHVASTEEGLIADQKGLRIEAREKRMVCLQKGDALQAPLPVGGTLLTYRAQMKAGDLEGKAYLEMWCVFDGGPSKGEHFSRSLAMPLTGTCDWASYETSFVLPDDKWPDHFKINVVIEGKGTVWIKDVELLRGPLPN
jgi:uncharacterized protein (TIGR03067 family)